MVCALWIIVCIFEYEPHDSCLLEDYHVIYRYIPLLMIWTTLLHVVLVVSTVVRLINSRVPHAK